MWAEGLPHVGVHWCDTGEVGTMAFGGAGWLRCGGLGSDQSSSGMGVDLTAALFTAATMGRQVGNARTVFAPYGSSALHVAVASHRDP